MTPELPKKDLQGQILKRRAMPEFILTENLYQPGLRIPKHYHNNGIVGCVLRGSYTNTYHRAAHEVSYSTIMFCPPGEAHTTCSNKGAHCFNLELKPEWVEELHKESVDLNGPATFEWSFMTWLARRLYKEFNEIDKSSALAIEGLALEMIAEVYRCRVRFGKKAPHWLDQVREMLHARFTEPLTVVSLAEKVSIHPVYLASTFRHTYGCSIGDYIRQLRVNLALHQLADSDDSLAEIAQAAGFSDQSHFSRVFKRCTGMTPARYRLIFRNP